MTLTEPHSFRRGPVNMHRVLALFLSLLILPATAFAQTEARVYELQNRPADDVAQQIRELYQNAPVTITARGQQVVVRGEPALLDEIGMLIDTMDVAPAQLRITVRSRQDIGGKRSGAAVSGSRNGSTSPLSAKSPVPATASSERWWFRMASRPTLPLVRFEPCRLLFRVDATRRPSSNRSKLAVASW